jgi:hypothetical protein
MNKELQKCGLVTNKRTVATQHRTHRNSTDWHVAMVTLLCANRIHCVHTACTFLATVYTAHTSAMTHILYSHRHSNSQLLQLVSGARCRPQREID